LVTRRHPGYGVLVAGCDYLVHTVAKLDHDENRQI